MMKDTLNIAFVNPPHADYSLTNNMTYLITQSHYNLVNKYKDKVNSYCLLQQTNTRSMMKSITNKDADLIMFSSYA